MKNAQSKSRKPASLLAMFATAAVAALAMFVMQPGSTTNAQSIDNGAVGFDVFQSIGGPSDNGGSNVFNAPGDDDDDCDDDDDDDYNGPPPGGNNNHHDDDDDCDDDDDDRDCDRHGRDRDCCDRRDRGRDHRDRDCDRDDDDCDDDRDHRDRDRRDRDKHDDDCDEDATITISKDADGPNATFRFTGDLGSFTLGDGDSKTFKVDRGNYTVYEDDKSGWELQSITCSGNGIATKSVSQSKVSIHVSDGDHMSCEFNNEGDTPAQVVAPLVAPTPIIIYVPVPAPQPVVRAPEPPRAPEPARPVQTVAALPRTGEGAETQSASLALPLGLAGALIVAGAGYVAVRRMRDTD